MGSASPAAPGVSNQAQVIAPPYAAALTPSGPGWRSSLAREGRIPLVRPVVQIGRLEGNDIVLTDLLASRYHAAIRWTPQGYEIEDLGSSNGTYVQGRPISGRVLLAPGQTIRIGSSEFVFNELRMPGQATPPVAQVRTPPGQPAALPVVPPAPAPGLGQAQPLQARGPVALTTALAHPYYAQAAQRRENRFVAVLKTEWRKRYWRIFLLGILAYIVVAQVLYATANLHLVPLVLLLASAVVPATFVMFCWEQNALADMPLGVVGVTFMLGGVLGLTIAAVLEPVLLPPLASTGSITLAAAILIGLCEETAKIVCVLWFLRDKRLRSELDGLILGAAAGMGFAALETAGYGFVAFLQGFVAELQLAASQSLSSAQATVLAIEAGATQMNYQLVIRMALAIFGHGVWTAIVAAAIWRERGQSTFRLTWGVIVAFAIAVGLHALWDWSPLANLMPTTTDPLVALVVIFGWFLFVGLLGLFILRFFLRESIQRAKFGPYAPPPPPLVRALLDYMLHPFRSPRLQPGYPYVPYPYAAQQMQQMQQLPAQGMGYPQAGQPTVGQGYQGKQQQYPPANPPPGSRAPGV
ncbi:MAG: PrsW family glutamic-type intramembrane protease [Ktedonobacterales bacterium]